ncbi:MAG: hypothetical protein MR564_07540, partial [Paraprevotella sp.]|nr:hypothetical protein [Paraprevotella sp.]
KMVLNMISTTLMIRMGRVRDNRMVNMQLTNAKLVDRGTHMIQEQTGLSYEDARKQLLKAGSVSKALKLKTSSILHTKYAHSHSRKHRKRQDHTDPDAGQPLWMDTQIRARDG